MFDFLIFDFLMYKIKNQVIRNSRIQTLFQYFPPQNDCYACCKNLRFAKYKTPVGTVLNCKGWIQEAALRMLLNNLDPAVAERPEDLIVYGGRGKAARNIESLDLIIQSLKKLENDETLLIQSGKPVGILKTHTDAPRVLLSNSQLVPNWANWKHFTELEQKGLMMYGQMTAGSWIYIGSQGIVQGTYETLQQLPINISMAL